MSSERSAFHALSVETSSRSIWLDQPTTSANATAASRRVIEKVWSMLLSHGFHAPLVETPKRPPVGLTDGHRHVLNEMPSRFLQPSSRAKRVPAPSWNGTRMAQQYQIAVTSPVAESVTRVVALIPPRQPSPA